MYLSFQSVDPCTQFFQAGGYCILIKGCGLAVFITMRPLMKNGQHLLPWLCKPYRKDDKELSPMGAGSYPGLYGTFC
jgi:hypothetical protein